MSQTLTTTQHYAADFERLRHGGPEWLRELRSNAFDRFQELGFPTARHANEAWKYTDIRPIAGEAFEYSQPQPLRRASFRLPRLLPFDEGFARIAVIDGRFAPEHSTGLEYEGLRAMSLSEAIEDEPDVVRKYLGTRADWSSDAFVALNTAFTHDGVFLHARQPIHQPVHIVYATTATLPVVTHPRTLIVSAPLSHLTIIETYVSLNDGRHFTNAVTEVVLEDGAQLDHHRLLVESREAFHVGRTAVRQGRDTTFRSLAYSSGGGLARQDLTVLLDAPGGSTDLRGLYITADGQHIDNNVTIDHSAPHATSRLYYKGILDGKSRAVFGGTVFVRPGAVKTDAHQQDKNLLLSHEAEVDSKPSLEIYADDVKCGHGATAGAIADEALFYMQSRGIDPETAMLMLVRGFAAEILDAVSIEPLREYLEQATTQALPRFRQVEEAA